MERPAPVPLRAGDKTLATAYAQRPPGQRAGTEHWGWIVIYNEEDGTRVSRSLGRMAEGEVGPALAAYFHKMDPSAVTEDGSGIRTIADLSRAYFAHLKQRQETSDRLADHTLKAYKICGKRLVTRAGDVSLSGDGEQLAFAVRDRLLAGTKERPGGYAPRTVKQTLKYLRAASLWAQRKGVEVSTVPIGKAAKFRSKAGQRYVNRHSTPTEAEILKVYAGMRRCSTKLAMLILWKTGCRIAEAAFLTWGDITRDGTRAWVSFTRGKTGARKTPITIEVFEEISAYRPEEAQDGDTLFERPRTTASMTGTRLASASTIRGVTPFTCHGLRRAYSDACLRAGVEVATYADITGHSVETALKFYRAVTDADRVAALDQLHADSESSIRAWLRDRDMSEREAIAVLEEWVAAKAQQPSQSAVH